MALGFTTTVTVIVAEVPLDDGVTIDGLNAQLVPLGAPVTRQCNWIYKPVLPRQINGDVCRLADGNR
jgi:hypothetical protein